VGAGVWFAVRLERTLDSPVQRVSDVASGRPQARPEESRTARRAYPVRCAHGRSRPDAPDPAARHPVRRAAAGGARAVSQPRPHPVAPGRQIMSPDQQPTR
jgi:hypothetical protein